MFGMKKRFHPFILSIRPALIAQYLMCLMCA